MNYDKSLHSQLRFLSKNAIGMFNIKENKSYSLYELIQILLDEIDRLNGVDMKPQKQHKRSWWYRYRDDRIVDLFNDKMSAEDIAMRLGVSYDYVRHLVIERLPDSWETERIKYRRMKTGTCNLENTTVK